MDALKYVAPNQPLVLEAGTWNRFIDAARRSEGETRQAAGARALEGNPWRPAVTVWVNNTGGTAIAPRAILTPTAVALDPAADPFEARRNPIVTAAAPASAASPVVIALDGIGPGEIGRAVVAGVTVAQVSVTSTAHRFAKPIAGASTHLASAADGPVRLLVPPVATGTQNVYVVLGSAGTSASDGDPDDGLTNGECKGSAWTIALRDTDRWKLQMLGGPGPIVIEPPDSDDDTEITINGVVYLVDWVYGAPSLTFTPKLGSGVPITATLDCLACPCFRFGVERIKFFPLEDIAAGVCERLVYFTVCQYCPAGWWCGREPGTDDLFEPVELLEGEACSGAIELLPGGPYESEAVARLNCGSTPGSCSPFVPADGSIRNAWRLVLDGVTGTSMYGQACSVLNRTWDMVYRNAFDPPAGCYIDVVPDLSVDTPIMRVLWGPTGPSGHPSVRLWITIGLWTYQYFYDEFAAGLGWDWNSPITFTFDQIFQSSGTPTAPGCTFPTTIYMYPV